MTNPPQSHLSKPFWLASLLLLAILAVPLLASGQSPPTVNVQGLDVQPLDGVRQLTTDLVEPHKTFEADQFGRVKLIIQLDGAPLVANALAEGEQARFGSPNEDASFARASASQRALVSAQQQQLETALNELDLSAEIGYSYDTIFNGMSVEVSAETVPSLWKLPNVKNIYPNGTMDLHLDASLGQINAATLWDAVGGQDQAGAGVKVAVIDSGIEPINPLFGGTDFVLPGGYPKGYCVTDDPSFCNNKLIAARWYGDEGEIPAGADGVEVASPLDRLGHGSHVAGIAVGNADVSANNGDNVVETLSGVAPRAYLMVYKACWRGASCPVAGLLAAIEDAVTDGADVINNSWGGGAGGAPSTSVFREAIENAVAAGVTMVFSAGNDGPDSDTISCPACVEETIAVGAVTTNRVHANRLDVTAPVPVPNTLQGLATIAAVEQPLVDDLGATITYGGAIDDTNHEGCNAWPANAFSFRIALVARGTCAFQTKVDNADAAGALALIIINDVDGSPERFSIGNGEIPTLMISRIDGNNLRDWTLANPNAAIFLTSTVERFINPDWADIMAVRSARGPNGDPNILKPDVAAPGVRILSADDFATGGTGFQFDSGTSMASPHVAGAAALLTQLHPGWSPQQIKTAITSSAIQDGIVQEDVSFAATPFDMGAGRIDLGRLAEVVATFAEPSYANADCVVICTWQNAIRNETGAVATWQATTTADDGVEIEVSSATLVIAAGSSADFTVKVNVSNVAADQWVFGEVIWTHNDVDQHLPVAVWVGAGQSELFEKSAETPFRPKIGDIFTYTLAISNTTTMSQTYVISDPLPANTTYMSGTATAPLVYNEAENELNATVTVPPAYTLGAQFLPGVPANFTLSSNPKLQLDCSGLCDDDWFAVPAANFEFDGMVYQSVNLNANGFVSLNAAEGASATPQRLPDPTAPNAVIAPLWADLDLVGEEGDPAGGGALFGGVVSINGTTYTIIEWHEAEHWGDPNVVYSFQLWLESGGNEIWFRYIDLDNFDVRAGAIGIEDGAGKLGGFFYYKQDEATPFLGAIPGEGETVFATTNGHTELMFSVSADSGTDVVNIATANHNGEILVATEETMLIEETIFLPILPKE